jgi:hypothetical protein
VQLCLRNRAGDGERRKDRTFEADLARALACGTDNADQRARALLRGDDSESGGELILRQLRLIARRGG